MHLALYDIEIMSAYDHRETPFLQYLLGFIFCSFHADVVLIPERNPLSGQTLAISLPARPDNKESISDIGW